MTDGLAEAAACEQMRERLSLDFAARPRRRSGPAGPTAARAAMLDCLVKTGAVARVVIHNPTGRRKQEVARARTLALVVDALVAEGADHLCIERRGAVGDLRDRVVLLDTLNPAGGSSAMSYDWRAKDEPCLWLADAVCGAVADFLLQAHGKLHHYARLQQAGVLAEPTYISETAP